MAKHYVVWIGKKPGVYDSWNETESQVKGFPGAKFKGFTSLQEAENAFINGTNPLTAKSNSVNNTLVQSVTKEDKKANAPSGFYLTVDAAYSHATKVLEWRGVLVRNNDEKEVFRSRAYQGGSANVGEFLGLIDAIHYLKEKELFIPIYSDSWNAQKWIRQRTHNSGVAVSSALGELMKNANDFLNSDEFFSLKNKIEIKDWVTAQWGEIPADFGRKTGKGLKQVDGPVL